MSARRATPGPQRSLIEWCRFCYVDQVSAVARVIRTIRWQEGEHVPLCAKCLEQLQTKGKVVDSEPWPPAAQG